MGGMLVFTHKNIGYKKNRWSIVALVIYLLFSFVENLFHWKMSEQVNQLVILFGVICVWYLYDSIIKQTFHLNEYKKLAMASSFTFFIYLFHEPTLNIVRKLIVAGIGKNAIGYMISYLVSPFVYVFVASLVASLLKRIVPKIYRNLVGGRI